MNVTERTSAVLILQRFVEVSRLLLPRYTELAVKENLTLAEQIKINKIQDVYDNLQLNVDFSTKLIDSNILFLINSVYNEAHSKTGYSPKTFHLYDAFIKESDRLLSLWAKQKLN